MNLIRQRDILKGLHKAKILTASSLHRALHSPVFMWEFDSLGDTTVEQRNIMAKAVFKDDVSMPAWMPFPCFRVCGRFGFDQWFSDPEVLKPFVFRYIYENDMLAVSTFNASVGAKNVLNLFHEGRELTEEKIKTMAVKDYSTGEVWDVTQEHLRQALWQPVHTLRDLLYVLQEPGFTALKVEPPNTPGKSVEWRMSRTHYCVVRRGAAKASQSGIKDITEHDLKRAVGWRISHKRKLTSERYTKKRGQTIQVKAAWVGPKEWIGLDKKIYKVSEFNPPPKESPAGK